MATPITIRFPSGASDEQVKKDAKKIMKSNPTMALHEALDVSAKNHGAPIGYKRFVTDARLRQEVPTDQDEHSNAYRKVRYCVKCERFATHDLGSIPKCAYHVDSDIDESEIPPYRGEIPENTVCFEQACDETATRIHGGACFCDEHYLDAKRGHRNRRNVLNILGISD